MTLQDIVPWGRNLDEYQAMFILRPEDFKGRILGCGDGPSSFNAEVTQQGGNVTSIDPIYSFTPEAIRQRIDETAVTVLKQVAQHQGDFIWNTIPSLEALETIRMTAMEHFLEDFERGKQAGRYIEASLPNLPFGTATFDLVLCSHFLFLYSRHLDLEFHIASIKAMTRIGKEVRIFPIIDLQGHLSSHLQPVIEYFKSCDYHCHIITTNYEFQQGGNQMLQITPR